MMDGVAETQSIQIAKVAEGLRNALMSLENITEASQTTPRGFVPSNTQSTDTLTFAQQLYSERRKREKHFEEEQFGEPQWDIMLDLFIGEKCGKKISVSSACIGASVPPTTALRHIVWLTEQHRVVRVPDENDSRRVYLKLSADMMERMERYLSETIVARQR
jgi:hypothetical protein